MGTYFYFRGEYRFRGEEGFSSRDHSSMHALQKRMGTNSRIVVKIIRFQASQTGNGAAGEGGFQHILRVQRFCFRGNTISVEKGFFLKDHSP